MNNNKALSRDEVKRIFYVFLLNERLRKNQKCFQLTETPVADIFWKFAKNNLSSNQNCKCFLSEIELYESHFWRQTQRKYWSKH